MFVFEGSSRSTPLAKAKRVKGIECGASVLDNAGRIVDVRLGEMLSFGTHAWDPQRVAEIHNLRIAAKRLRYTLEMFRFAYPKELSGLIAEVKEIQEHIGNMRDADVMIERVHAILARENQARAERLQQIATATGRGTVSQRHQRVRSAVTAPKAARDEIALYTLIAQRADERDAAYLAFVTAWERLEATDFPGRLRRLVGLDLAEALAELTDDGSAAVAESISEVSG